MDDSWNLIARSLPLLLQGAWTTLQLSAIAGSLSLLLGTLLGLLTCERLRTSWLATPLELMTFILRAVPFYVQLLIAYFVVPDLLGVDLDAFTASVIALGICSAGYTSQTVRAGINAVSKEQWEAASTLGYSNSSALRRIILPQAMRYILPALTNECDALLKSTAILSSIGLLELTRAGMNIVSREMEPMAIYLAVAALYVAISAGVNFISRIFERRLSYVNS